MERQKPRLTVLSGPSGVGKGTLVKALRKNHPQLWLSVSATTRAARLGEVEAIDYFFKSNRTGWHFTLIEILIQWAYEKINFKFA